MASGEPSNAPVWMCLVDAVAVCCDPVHMSPLPSTALAVAFYRVRLCITLAYAS